MGRLHLRNRHVPQFVHRIEERIFLNEVADLHVGANGTRLVESSVLLHFRGQHIEDDGHGTTNESLQMHITLPTSGQSPT